MKKPVKKTKSALPQADDHYRQLAEDMPALICTFLPDSTLTYVNASYCELFSKRPDELVGQKFLDFLPDEATRENVRSQYMSLTHENPVKTYEHEVNVGDDTSTAHWHRWTDRAFFNDNGEIKYFQSIGQNITERKQAEETLQEAHWRLDSIIKGTHVGTWEWNVQTGATVFNDEWAQIIGYTLDELAPISISTWGKYAHPDDLQQSGELLERHFAGKLPYYDYDCRMKHKDGHWVWVQDRGRVETITAEGKPLLMFGTHTDITLRKQAEIYREVGLEVLKILDEPGDLRDSIGRVIAALKTHTGFDAVGIRLQNGDDYPYFTQEGFPSDFLQTENTLIERAADGGVCRDENGNVCLECTCGLVISGKTDPANRHFTQGGSFWTSNSFPVLDSPPGKERRLRSRNRCIHEGYVSMALVPIRNKDRIVGLIHLNDRRQECFTKEIIELIEEMSSRLGLALMRRQMEERLRESQRFALATLNALSAQVAILDEVGSIISVNQSWNDFSAANAPPGADLKIYEGVNYLSVCETSSGLYSEEGKVMVAGIGLVMSGKQEEFTLEYPCHSPEEKRWFNARVTRFTIEGTLRILVAHENITERKQAEEALRESEQKFRRITENMSDFVVELDAQGIVKYLSPSNEKAFGRSVFNYVGKLVFDYVHPEDRDLVLTKFMESLATKTDGEMEYRIRHEDGHYVWVRSSGHYILDEAGEVIGCIINSQDITERRRLEEEREESVARLKEVLENALDASYKRNLLTNTYDYLSPIFANISGYSPDEFRLLPIETVLDIIHPEDLANVEGLIAESMSGTHVNPCLLQYRFKHKDGQYRWFDDQFTVMRNVQGQPVARIGSVRDITKRVQAEAALKESETNYRHLFQNASIGIFHSSPEGRFLRVNSALAKMMGYMSPEEMISAITNIGTQIYVDSEKRTDLVATLDMSKWACTENRYRRKDGAIIIASLTLRRVLNNDSTVAYLEGFVEDITERRRMEIELINASNELENRVQKRTLELAKVNETLTMEIMERMKSEELYRLLTDNSNDAIWTMTLAGKVTYVSPSIINLTGFTPEEAMEMPLQAQMVESSATRVIAVLADQLQKPPPERVSTNLIEVQLNCKDGTIKDVEIIAGWLLNDRGEPIGIQGSSRDITSRKRAENDLKESEEWNRDILRTVLSGVLVIDAATRKIVEANDTALKLIGLPKEQVVGCVCHKFICPAEEKSCPILDLGNNVDSAEKMLLTADGKQKTILKTVTPIEFRDKRYLIESFIDLTARKQAEGFLRDVIIKNPMSVQILDKDGISLEVNPSFELLFGAAPPSDYSIFNDIQLTQQGMGPIFRQLRDGEVVHFPDTFFNVRDSIPGMPDVPVWIKTVGFPLNDSNGKPERFILMHENITERKRAENEKSKLESQLLQAQKMEAVGQLAGGIAHDFKNMLGSISGFTELTLGQVPADSKANKYLKRIFGVSNRAVELVNQILIFSRKEATHLKPLRLTPLLNDVIHLVKAIMPKTIDIRQNIKAESDVVMVNATNIHQVVMNLCSNAIFAMQKKGGVLTIDLINESILPGDLNHPDVNPGFYLKLTISDTGDGIDPAVIDKIFDPFFTTKKQGEGTGMGLSVVHGIVKSLGGDIKVKSSLVKGTSFEVLLPALSDIVTESIPEEDTVSIRGSGRIIFVDDEEDMVDIATDMLSGLGYEVTATQGAIEALEIFRANPSSFDLVITDQSMPEMTGIALAREIMRIRPEIPIILCTAFSGDLTEQDIKNAGLRELVSKPMVEREIAKSIHHILKNKPLTDVVSLAVMPDDVNAADLPPAFGLAREQFTGVRALVADDQDFNRELILALLQEMGIDADMAINGREALEMIRLRNYDIVLMDIEMPEMDGLTATRKIRKLGTVGVSHLPIIALSAHSITDDNGKSQAAGMNDYLTKPIDTVLLFAMLQKWLPREKNTAVADDAPDIMTSMQANGLDEQAALKRLGGNRKLYLKLMGVFMDGYAEAPAQLQQEIHAGKWEDALRRVHSIKGVAGTIGSTALQDAAARLEEIIRVKETCDHPSLAEPLQIFNDCHAALVKTLGLFLSGESDVSPVRKEDQPWEASKMRHLLTRLKIALESEEPLLCNKTMEELLQRPCPDGQDAALAKINQLINDYRLAEALALLEKEFKDVLG